MTVSSGDQTAKWGWDETNGAVSRAFDIWSLDQKDIRAFMRVGLRFGREAYERIWQELGAAPSDEEGLDDLPDAFHRAVSGLWPNDFEWMLLAAVLKDAVSAYELYLERAADEVLNHHGFAIKKKDPEKSLDWRSLLSFYSTYLGIALESDGIKRVRALRHILVHQRGELRTERQRQRFQEPDSLISMHTPLSEENVETYLGVLETEVRRVDQTIFRFSWGGDRLKGLLEPEP